MFQHNDIVNYTKHFPIKQFRNRNPFNGYYHYFAIKGDDLGSSYTPIWENPHPDDLNFYN